jgi:hypothetical protein
VIVGVYLLETMERLPVGFNSEADEEPQDHVLLLEFEITDEGRFVSERLDQLLPAPAASPTAEATSGSDEGDGTALEPEAIAVPRAPTSAP